MVKRKFWLKRIAEAWKRRPVLWLSGLRRSGKTVLCRSVPGVEYFDCERPRTRRMMEDPESFLEGLAGKRVVLDEVHRLRNPSELLKIAADHYPSVRLLATGSSTLGVSAKFRDTLSGRKRDLWLTPMILADMRDAGTQDLHRRLRHGGLPPFFLADSPPQGDFEEWMDAYWARDIQELFRLEKRQAFMRMLEMLMRQSGGIFEASAFAAACEVSRQTAANYLAVLEATFTAHVLRPYHRRRPAELVSAPKVYAFDTGFVCHCRGWNELRGEDLGLLWEHLVLNELHARAQSRRVLYWRNKQGREVDFILERRAGPPAAVECKWSAKNFDASGMASFRALHPGGENYAVCRDVDKSFTERFGELRVHFMGLEEFGGLAARLLVS